jgi:Ca2+-binding EF-hand superfamily protein
MRLCVSVFVFLTGLLLAYGVLQAIGLYNSSMALVRALHGVNFSLERVLLNFMEASAADRAVLGAWYGTDPNTTAVGMHYGLAKFGFDVPLETINSIVRNVDLDADGEVSAADAAYGLTSAAFYGYVHYHTHELTNTPCVVAVLDTASVLTRGKLYNSAIGLPALTRQSAINFARKTARKNPAVWLRLSNMAVDAASAVALETAATALPLFDQNKDGLTLQELQAGLSVWAMLTGSGASLSDSAARQMFLWMDTNHDGRTYMAEVAPSILAWAGAAKSAAGSWLGVV